MCGFAGVVYFDKDRIVDAGVLKRMTDSIYHRGPDDEGFHIDGNVGLGFRRLSIIDLYAGHQPLFNEDNSLCIVFNGEIYNYQEQRNLLIQKGYKFKTATDTEVILLLYEEYGVDCLRFLRGMFALVIFDKREQRLFCARDRFGIKPFYFYKDDEKFVFGSEIKAIISCDKIDKTLSNNALNSYFSFGYIPGDLSIYSKINKLQASQFLLLSLKEKTSIAIENYWRIKFEPDFSRSEHQWKEELVDCLSETVKLHMISDVPLGAFLSGGIDSSSVVAMMAKNSTLPVKTFSIGFKEQKFNELAYAREVAKKNNCEHHEQIVEPESINLLPKLVRAYDEPFADSSAIPTYYVSKLAREHVTVALSGDGGDELFAGYDIYSYFSRVYNFPFNLQNKLLNNLLWGNLSRVLPNRGKIKNTLYFLSKERAKMHAYLNIWSPGERSALFAGEYHELAGSSPEFHKLHLLEDGSPDDFVSSLQYLDLRSYMVDDILTKVDRASMLNSLEVRVPLLDHKFAELSFKIPSKLKLRGRDKKHILKSAMKPYLSDNILNHQKQGFSMPLAIWFKDDLITYIKDTLLIGSPKLSSYIDLNFVRSYIEKDSIQDRYFSEKIWSLLFFEEWLTLFEAE
jgi:asparagine synthase (glutamine-hydrolysing)